MRRLLHISPPSGMAVIRQIPLKEEKKISDCNRRYYKILHAPTEAKKITLYKQIRKMQHVLKREPNKTSKKIYKIKTSPNSI